MMQSVLRALDRHWFAPASLRDLAVVRIVLAGSLLLCFLPSLAYQLSLAHADPATFNALPVLKVLMLPFGGWGIRPEPMFLRALWLATIVAGILATVGLGTRRSLFALAGCYTVLMANQYSYGEVHHPEAIYAIMLWVLAIAPSGEALSGDGLRRRIDRALGGMRFEPITAADELSDYARWPLRVGQWLLVLAYLSAGLSKLTNGGLAWFNGYTLVYYLVQDGVRWGNETVLTLARYPALCGAISIWATLFELTFAIPVLVPRLVWPYVLTGVAMHTGIYLLQRAPFFTFIALYIVFLESLRATWPASLRPASARPWTIVYDGLCPLCIRSMVILDYFDLRRQLRYVDFERDWTAAAATAPALTPERARVAMHVVSPNGQVYSGFPAFRALSRVLPILWPVLPLFYAPLSSRVGPVVYRIVAGNRGRLVCRADTCAI